MRRSLAWILVVAASWTLPVSAQNDVGQPRSYALTNARIVVAPGQVVENGTIVIRNGRITAVGASVTVPAGLVPMDLNGATVYPGLIDAASSIGLPAVAQAGRGGGRGGEAVAESAGPPPELDPGRNAIDVFSPGADGLAGFRAAGITTVGLAFTGGIFPGRVSAIDVKDGPPAQLVVRSPVAQQVAFGRKRGGYPSTLMGALAYIEQSFKDARYDARVRAAFETSPGTTPLPPYDAEHQALLPAAAGNMPVWFEASRAYDIERVIDLAARAGITDYTIVGGQEGFMIVPQLVATKRPVIVSLDFPQPNEMTGRSFELRVAPVSGEDTAGEQADSADARKMRGNAAALIAAGIPVAFSSMGLADPAGFRSGLIALVAGGLSRDEALRAATITPAGLLGVQGATGTIEAGKLANLVVVNGDLFDAGARIRHVFVQGEKYDIPAPAPADGRGGRGGRGGGAPGAAAVATGEWTGSIDMQGQVIPFTLTISADGMALSASMDTEYGSTAMRGEQDGASITLSGVAETPDGQIPITLTGQIEGDRMTGTLDVSGMGTATVSARRGGSSAGTTAGTDGGNR